VLGIFIMSGGFSDMDHVAVLSDHSREWPLSGTFTNGWLWPVFADHQRKLTVRFRCRADVEVRYADDRNGAVFADQET
jgi:hypothetical protein